MELGEILNQPMTLEKLKDSFIFIPRDAHGNICKIDDAVKSEAYRYTENRSKWVGFLSRNEYFEIIYHGIVIPRKSDTSYSLIYAVKELTVGDCLEFMESLERTIWEDVIVS